MPDISGVQKALSAAGYKVDDDELKRWGPADVAQAISFCEALASLKGKEKPPSAPACLRGQERVSRKRWSSPTGAPAST